MVPTVTDLCVNIAGGQYGLVQSVDCTGSCSTALFIHDHIGTVPMSLGGIFTVLVFVVLLVCVGIRFRKRLIRHDAA